LQPNSSFKPTPLHGIVLSFGVRLLSLRLHLVAARLNSGVRPVKSKKPHTSCKAIEACNSS
ncbi:hypothetical protein K7B09_12845, partial [Thermomonas sp. RSS23]